MFLIPNIYKIEYTFPSLIFFFVHVAQISILYYTNRSSNDPKIFVYFFSDDAVTIVCSTQCRERFIVKPFT